jgi:signal transduction histidine kinase/CheY-like chemotaxis protein
MDVIGTIGLDILQKGRTLEEDEFRLAETIILQAAAAIQSVRLFEQTQVALAESEALYQANSEFNTAQTYSAVLDMLRRYTVLGSNVRYISLNLFDTHWKESFAPEWMIPIASWSVTPDTQPNNQQLLLTSWPAADQVMQPNFPTFITDPLNDPRLATTQEFFQMQDRQAESLLFAPLTVAGNWIGQIIAWYQTSLDFSESELRRLTTLVGQASVVIQNIHSAELTRQRAIQLERLAAVQAALSQAGSEREILSALVLPTDPQNPPQTIRLEYIHTGEAEQPEYTELVACWEDGSFLELASKTRTQVNAVPLANLWLLNPDEALFLENTNNQELNSDLRLNVYSGYQAFAIIPLRSGGAWQGLVIYAWEKARRFSADDKFILRRLLEPTSEVVARRRAFLQARQRAQEMTLLFTVSQMLSNAPLASEDIAAIITEQFAHVLEVPKCTLSLLEDGDHTSQLNMVGDFGIANLTGSSITNPTRSLSSHPLANKAVETLLPVVAQASDSGLAPHIQQYLQKNNLQTLLVIPLAVKGEAIGIIELISHQWPRFYSPDQLNLAMTLANAAAVALENARLYEEQRQTAERLQEVDQLKTQFLANMSHELRTPLNSIIGFSRVILKGIDGPITDLQEQDLGAIFNSGQHLLSLINDILDLSKIEAGKMELAIEEVDLGDMINSVMSTAIGLTKEKPIELQRDIQNNLPFVHVDRTRIRQVLINLLSNAAKFTDMGTIRVAARTQLNTAGKLEVWVGVSDTGPGIAPEDQDKLFKAFSQVDASPTRKTGGTGLGLSISRYLVEMHGGHIGIISEVGNGSTFFFTLPLPDSEKSIPTELSGDGPVILAVDDNSQILNLYERYLGNHNYQIYPLTDPEQSVHVAKQVQPYAITLDVMMPGRDGWSILSQLKQDPDTCHIPVVICSILEDQEKGFRLGAIDYLTKPILEEDLIQALNNLSNHSGLQTILVVGDEAEIRRLVETVAQQNGQYQLETAENEREALLILERITPNAIIVDGDLPGLDGHTLFETFQANPNLQNIPVIILSGDGLDETQPGWLAATGQIILQKSQITEDALLETLRCKLQPKSSQKTNFVEHS